MKQETRGKRKKICRGAAALTLAGVLAVQTGPAVSAGENETLEIVEGAEPATETAADDSQGQSEGTVSQSSPEQAGESVGEIPGEQAGGQMPENPAEQTAVETPDNREETSPGETPGEETGSTAIRETPEDQSGETASEKPADPADGRSEETALEIPEETPAPLQEMNICFSVNSSLGGNELKLGDGQEAFAKSLFSQEEISQGGQVNVLVYADPAENLLKPEEQKGEAQKLAAGERSALEAEKEALSQWAVQNGYEVQQCFALRLKKYRDGETAVGITESTEKLRMTLTISGLPEGAQSAALVCVKNGQAVICEDLDPALETITFDSSTFGTYALVLSATLEEEPENQPEEAAEQETIVMEVDGENAVYQPGEKGRWDPETHSYVGGTSGHWIYEDGEGKIILKNTGSEDLTVVLSYQPSESHQNITGSFTDQEGKPVQELSVAAGGIAQAYLTLAGEPEPGTSCEVIGNVNWTLAE